MAASKNDRLAPPLMHAFRAAHDKRDAKVRLDLRDEAGERVIAARRMTTRSPISESGLRREVTTDLLGLFNTTNLDAATDLSALPAVRNSILNYGFPDLSWRSIDENSLAEIAREIEVALGDFEPRLAAGSIRASRDVNVAAEELKLRFLVRADLRTQPVNSPVEFVAEVEFDSGKIKSIGCDAMNREFLEFYNRELSLLREQAGEFAQEYPEVAERLGGLMADRLDPMIAGLLEGAAFLAARVQLKLKHEFSDFTTNLIDQLAPHYLAPTPSFLLAQVQPKFGDPALREGHKVARGAYFDAAYRELERNVACRFRLAAPITLWPFEIARAEYFTSAGPLQALGLRLGADCAAGLRLQLSVRATPRLEDEPADKEAETRPELRFSACRVKDLRFHILGQEADAIALYEQAFAHCRGVYFRFLDAFGDPIVIGGADEMLRQIGFDEDEALLPNDKRVFRGFDFLRDYFAFPRRFLGFDLVGLAAIAPRLTAKSVDIVLAFDDVNPRLAAAVRKEFFALYAAPAVNLFEKTLDRIPVKTNQHEYPVVPDRSRALDFEPNRIVNVFAHIPGVTQKVAVEPLYSAPAARSASGLCYTVRRLPRRRTAEERKYGHASDYTGTDMFLSLGERSDPQEVNRVAELSVQALCTNRHLTEHLPVGEGGADFRFLDNVDLEVRCIAGPTHPREPTMTAMAGKLDGASIGDVAWRLINMLSLNHLGLIERAAGEGAKSLRETLLLFADVSDSATERKIRGLRNLDARPIVRRVRQVQGAAAARGLEVAVLIDDKAFEGSGAFLIGAVLDRFFAEYVAINHFTQVVIRTTERGEIMRWPPRLGLRGVL